jgi:hypothetical protein
MNQGIKTVIYPVKDIARAKSLFSQLLGAEPYADQPYYVGFRVGDQDIGLDPHGHKAVTTATITLTTLRKVCNCSWTLARRYCKR